ncbi:unnamed protein product [Trichogramma brassicae]|uniref:Reverse transcriptase domain-containing protein n=1 Tax=Trichogramma brassicae TaxID=86971 RepID=A0A6H5J3W8_9HYME|nr:unnamed protein product [Trichogramma brassicae]
MSCASIFTRNMRMIANDVIFFSNATQTFQRYVDSALRDLDFIFVYLDDILVASSSEQEHQIHLTEVVERLQRFSLQLNLDKCVIGQESVEFLGYVISPHGANGIIERWHRTLKAALMCQAHPENWLDLLPSVLLGLRPRLVGDFDVSPAEMLYGTALAIPVDLCFDTDARVDPKIFANKFHAHMNQVRPVPVKHKSKITPFVAKELSFCTHVFKLVKKSNLLCTLRIRAFIKLSTATRLTTHIQLTLTAVNRSFR